MPSAAALSPAELKLQKEWDAYFGAGYGYVPLVLPFFGLWWIWRHRDR